DKYVRSRALSGLAAQLSGKQRDEVMDEALAAAKAIGDEHARAQALSGLAAQLSGERLGDALRAFLSIGHRLTRPLFLHDVQTFMPAIRDVAGEDALQALAKAVMETARWFP